MLLLLLLIMVKIYLVFFISGRRIAELEIETFLARAIQNFKVEWFGPPIQVTPSSLNYITGPFNFVFKDV